jgi:hypothetical protein
VREQPRVGEHGGVVEHGVALARIAVPFSQAPPPRSAVNVSRSAALAPTPCVTAPSSTTAMQTENHGWSFT